MSQKGDTSKIVASAILSGIVASLARGSVEPNNKDIQEMLKSAIEHIIIASVERAKEEIQVSSNNTGE